MKHIIKHKENQFNPVDVNITFESQDELDRFWVLLNHSDITDFLKGDWISVWQSLEQFRSEDYSKKWNELIEIGLKR